MSFKLHSPYKPTGDQPQAIEYLTNGVNAGMKHQTLLGVTGSGKTFTVANLIQNVNKPTLVISHNKTLAAQLYQEYKEFFPDNAVEYFVSYYDYYQPEAYIPKSDTYIEKDASINEDIDKLRLSATTALMTRSDVIVVASVSAIYNLGSAIEYKKTTLTLKEGMPLRQQDLFARLVQLYYTRSDYEFKRGTFRVTGETVDIFPAYLDSAIRLVIFDDKLESIKLIHPVTGKAIKANDEIATPDIHQARNNDVPLSDAGLTGETSFLQTSEPQTTKATDNPPEAPEAISNSTNTLVQSLLSKLEKFGEFTLYPAKHYVADTKRIKKGIEQIKKDLEKRVKELESQNKSIEAYRLKQKTEYDLEMLEQIGYCKGIENYSRYFDGRKPGEPPFSLLDYFPEDQLIIIDESHITVPQIKGMYNGDRARKETLIDFGFRLPSALDNRPLTLDEFLQKANQIVYTSATPSSWEMERSIEEYKRITTVIAKRETKERSVIASAPKADETIPDRSPRRSAPRNGRTQSVLTGEASLLHTSQYVDSTIDGNESHAPIVIANHKMVKQSKATRNHHVAPLLVTTGNNSLTLQPFKYPQTGIVEQLIRPTGLIDPEIIVRGTKNQIENLIDEIIKTVKKKQRVLVTTLTKRMAEDLTDYLREQDISVQYLHSDVDTLDRVDILNALRKGEYDVIVGINLLREGLDLPEVSLVAILDADKEGFLRSETSLIQTMGRAARHVEGKVIMYADKVTGSMQRAIDEVNRRRKIQLEYNKKHKITPKSINKPIRSQLIERSKKVKDYGSEQLDIEGLLQKTTNYKSQTPNKSQITSRKHIKQTEYDATTDKLISELNKQMKKAAKELDFETAARIRDRINMLKG